MRIFLFALLIFIASSCTAQEKFVIDEVDTFQLHYFYIPTIDYQCNTAIFYITDCDLLFLRKGKYVAHYYQFFGEEHICPWESNKTIPRPKSIHQITFGEDKRGKYVTLVDSDQYKLVNNTLVNLKQVNRKIYFKNFEEKWKNDLFEHDIFHDIGGMIENQFTKSE